MYNICNVYGERFAHEVVHINGQLHASVVESPSFCRIIPKVQQEVHGLVRKDL
jgi:hypothetical protein